MRKSDENWQLDLHDDDDDCNDKYADESYDDDFEENEDYFYKHDFKINKDKISEP